MNKIFFFFTKINNPHVYSDELMLRNFFIEKEIDEIDQRVHIEHLGFNRSEGARIVQLFFLEGRVQYHYILDFSEVLVNNYPLVFLICDNEYRENSDDLLNSLFHNFSENTIYCYFHENNSAIKDIILKSFANCINGLDSFHHEKGEPFFELISLIDVDSQETFERKTEEIQYRYLGTDEEMKKKGDLNKKLTLLHKILGQNYRLKDNDQEEIENFLTVDFTYKESLESLTQLCDHLLNYTE